MSDKIKTFWLKKEYGLLFISSNPKHRSGSNNIDILHILDSITLNNFMDTNLNKLSRNFLALTQFFYGKIKTRKNIQTF